jgi:8-oxo-dGTP pyrophosphatase MutT (NUDIX family)
MQAPRLNLSEEEIARRLAIARRPPTHPPFSEHPYPAEHFPQAPRPAAVLIPLLRQENSWHILFTRRTATLAEHSGQVAYPGGRSDPVDLKPEITALREAWEEIGLEPGDVRVLGLLNDFLTITNYRVTPVVGVIPWPYPLRLADDEVSRAFTIPLDWLANPANYEEHQRTLPAPYQPVSVFYFHPYDNEVLWGASARFTLELVDVLTRAGQDQVR